MPTPVEFEPISFETFLSKLSAKDRLNVERHAAALDEDSDPNRAKVWKGLACTLMALAPQSPKAGGQQNLQYFVPDGPSGKYRMQVFALQDLRDGKILIYTGAEALAAAVASGLLTGPGGANKGDDADEDSGPPNTYRIRKSHDALRIDEIDGRTENLQPVFKDMVGWNRKALRITIPAAATPAQVQAVETLCALSARKWTPA